MADENSNGTDLPEQNDERAEHSMEPISPQANEQLVLDDNRVAHTDIQKEMRQSYLDYAISVLSLIHISEPTSYAASRMPSSA